MTLPLSLVLTLLLAHYIGDFILQTNEQATQKSVDSTVLWAHVWTWTAVLAVALIIYHFVTGYTFNANHATWWVFMMMGAHFITDFITSRMNRHFQANKRVKAFWNTIGFDQFLHAITLIGFASIWLAPL